MMAADIDFGFGAGFVPPKNLQYFLLILKEAKMVRGRIKLFKIHSLIEEEGHVKYNLPIDTFKFGPADYESFNFCNSEGLIEENKIHNIPHDYYEISLSEKGKVFFNQMCKPLMGKKEIKNAMGIINKYKSEPGNRILAHVHGKFVDPYKKPAFVKAVIEDSINRINVIINIVKNVKSSSDDDEQATLLGELSHLAEILKSLNGMNDPTKKGTILVNLNDFFEYLKIGKFSRNTYTVELFEFLDHYADKEGIQKSITSDDFSDITAEEKEKLFHAISTMDIPPRSN